MNKTNVMKFLEQKKIKYSFYILEQAVTEGEKVAELLNEPCEMVFKTLVTIDNNSSYHVFIVPVNLTLDLKLAAKLINKKSVDMIKQKDLEPLTGYIHGGCSPLCMKKLFPTYIDSSVNNYSEIYVSAGKVGVQIKIKVSDLISLTKARVESLTIK